LKKTSEKGRLKEFDSYFQKLEDEEKDIYFEWF
jgi:hypothetical protein